MAWVGLAPHTAAAHEAGAGAAALSWRLASQVRERLSTAIAHGEPLHLTPKPESDSAVLDALCAASAHCHGRTKALTLSNRGRFTLPCGPIAAFQHTTNIAPVGPVVQLSVVTLNGVLYLTLAYVRPAMEDATAAAMADCIVGTLTRASHEGAARA